VEYLGDNGQIEVESGPDSLMTINFAGNRVLQGIAVTGGQGVFDVLKDLERLLDGHLPLSRVGMSINFDSSVMPGTGFSAPDAVGTESPAASFLAEAQFSTTVTVFDDKGIGHDLVFVFAKTSTTSYSYRVLVDAADTGGSPGNFRQVATEGTLQFDGAGILDPGSSSLTDITVTGLSSGARDIDIDAAGISFAGSVETARPSELLSLQQSNGNGMAAQLARIDAAFNQVLVFRAEAGARLQSGELARDALDTWRLQLTGERSRIEDADILAAYSEFARLQTALNAALQAAAQVLKPSLLDFLR
jgi:flagellin-like hook-associated protein FlgL